MESDQILIIDGEKYHCSGTVSLKGKEYQELKGEGNYPSIQYAEIVDGKLKKIEDKDISYALRVKNAMCVLSLHGVLIMDYTLRLDESEFNIENGKLVILNEKKRAIFDKYMLIKKEKEEAIEIFYKTAAYQVGEQIKDELVKNGYGNNSNDLSWSISYHGVKLGVRGLLYLSKGDDKGRLNIYFDSLSTSYNASSLFNKNCYAMLGQFYAIQDDIGLLVESDTESKEIPPFIEIAARVIKNSEYKFVQPDWWFEKYPDARKYLNVMFR
jgi:hypothetical protein